MERHWEAVSGWLGELLADRGVDRISAEELTVPPGMDELFSLLQIKRHHESGEFDAMIVDCAPTGETLRLLSFPDVCTLVAGEGLPVAGRLMVAAARPLARGCSTCRCPGEAVFDDVERLVRNLVAMNAILRDRVHTSIRLVMNPDRMVVKEAMRTFTYLNLYGYLTDAVVVNRVLPRGGRRRLLRRLARAPAGAHGAGALRLRARPDPDRAVLRRSEVIGRGDARPARRRAVRRAPTPTRVLHDELTQELTAENGRATLRLPLPFAERGDIELKKIGLEVIVRVGGQKRTIILPPALAAYETSGARFEDGALEVDFEKAADGRSTTTT